MNTKELKNLIGQGEIKETIDVLLKFMDTYYARFSTEVLLISSRYNQVKKELDSGTLPRSDYKIEITSLSKNLIELVSSIEGLNENNFKAKKSEDSIIEEIMQLNERYEFCRKKTKSIQTTPTRLREKNEIARKLGEKFLNYPNLIDHFSNTEHEGVIVGIANNYKVVPDTKGIDIFEQLVDKTKGNFSRGCIVNALGEIVYSGQIRLGDDARIYQLLKKMSINADEPLKKNIARIKADLDYLLGKNTKN